MRFAWRLVVVCMLLLTSAAPLRGQGYPLETAARKMDLAPGLQATLFAGEPDVRQPILVKCDDRGRLWTIQYLQYPNPAGLKRVKVDRWSRTVYDRVPKPPPKGPRGADRITILEDEDGDGRADKFTDFVTGLNLATGLAFGDEGVYVLQVPYLLFYPDRNRDDVPDSEPRVLLTGFGMEDAQSLANHLTWGPDGWLYGVNGSTTTCRIRGIEFQQGVWRYQPRENRFELFCEGGGNTFGLAFDAVGNLLYSTNGGPFVHALQGGYYYKSFGKHGPLHNRFTFGHLAHVARDAVPGGPPTGGTIYQSDTLPGLRGRFLSGNFLGHSVSQWKLERRGESFFARFAGPLLDAKDTWFGPTDLCQAPDGTLFISDFHDQRTSHPDPDARWDRSNGRIYQISPNSLPTVRKSFDLRQASTLELVEYLHDRQGWFADRARVELGRRCDPACFPHLKQMVGEGASLELALRGLWALHVSGGLDTPFHVSLLQHRFPQVRRWAVRLAGDLLNPAPALRQALIQHATSEDNQHVKLQLAATAKRLSKSTGLEIIDGLLANTLSEHAGERLRMMLWWALEAQASHRLTEVVARFTRQTAWQDPLQRQLAENLIRRNAAFGDGTVDVACLKLVQSAPPGYRQRASTVLLQGLRERGQGLTGIGQGGLFEEFSVQSAGAPSVHPAKVDSELQQWIRKQWQSDQAGQPWLELALEVALPEASQFVLSSLRQPPAGAETQRLLRALQSRARPESAEHDSIEVILPLVADRFEKSTRELALRILAPFSDSRIDRKLCEEYPNMPADLRQAARAILLSRPHSAATFLQLVEKETIPASEVRVSELKQIALFRDEKLTQLVQRHWGKIRKGTPEEKLATMRRFNNDLRHGPGNPRQGQDLFQKHCGKCHLLFGKGARVGPDLTSANRQDRAALLANLVDPSAIVKRDYLSFIAETSSGQILTGLLAEQDGASVTLLDAENKRHRIPRSELEQLRPSDSSLMPERLLGEFSPQQVRDLFAYLQRSEPLP